MTYDELESLIHNPLPGKAIELAEAMTEMVENLFADGWGLTPEDKRTPQLAFTILKGAFIRPEYVHSQIKELVTDPKSEEEIVFHLSANGEECKITFDHDHRAYKLHIDTEDGSQVFSGTTLSLMMQMARDSFIKPRELADGFIPGAFIA